MSCFNEIMQKPCLCFQKKAGFLKSGEIFSSGIDQGRNKLLIELCQAIAFFVNEHVLIQPLVVHASALDEIVAL